MYFKSRAHSTPFYMIRLYATQDTSKKKHHKDDDDDYEKGKKNRRAMKRQTNISEQKQWNIKRLRFAFSQNFMLCAMDLVGFVKMHSVLIHCRSSWICMTSYKCKMLEMWLWILSKIAVETSCMHNLSRCLKLYSKIAVVHSTQLHIHDVVFVFVVFLLLLLLSMCIYLYVCVCLLEVWHKSYRSSFCRQNSHSIHSLLYPPIFIIHSGLLWLLLTS